MAETGQAGLLSCKVQVEDGTARAETAQGIKSLKANKERNEEGNRETAGGEGALPPTEAYKSLVDHV